jgi:hypothetical protein
MIASLEDYFARAQRILRWLIGYVAKLSKCLMQPMSCTGLYLRMELYLRKVIHPEPRDKHGLQATSRSRSSQIALWQAMNTTPCCCRTTFLLSWDENTPSAD